MTTNVERSNESRPSSSRRLIRVCQFRTALWCVIIGSWLSICVAGFLPLLSYDNGPGDSALPLPTWPASGLLKTTPGKYTLVAFLHPQCPCSRATVGELAICMAHYGKLVTAYALFLKPKTINDGWAKSDLFANAAAIPGVTTMLDSDGKMAHLFGAKTSGQVFLFNPSNQLVFSGGITDSRGHFGDNAGLDALSSNISGNRFAPDKSAVFGCALFAKDLGRKNQ